MRFGLDRITSLFRRDAAPAPKPVSGPMHLQRADGWQNFVTGVGTYGADKTKQVSYWAPLMVGFAELLAMFNGSDLAAKIVCKKPEEMFRAGYSLKLAAEGQQENIAKLTKQGEKLRLDELMQDAMVWGRLWGGSLLLLGVNDGQTPDKPLNEKTIRSVDYFNVVDRRFAWAQTYYSNPLAPNFGLPEKYLVTNGVSGANGATASVVIHESRTIRFEGNPTDVLTRQQLAGWSWSVLQRVYDTMAQFDQAFQGTGILLSDASQAVFKLKGLIDMIAGGSSTTLQQRMALVDMGRSTARAVILDAEEEDFKREPTSFTGISDVLDRFMMRLAAAADMPVTILFGRSAAGMNATGEGDQKAWFASVAADQKKYLAPKYKHVYRLMSLAKDSPFKGVEQEFEILFAALAAPSDKEQADTRLAVAQADAVYLTNEVVTPEEVATSHWSGGKYNADIQIDFEARKKALDNATKFDPYSKDPLHSSEAIAATGAPEQGEQATPVVPLSNPQQPYAVPVKP